MRERNRKATVLHILNGTNRPREARPDEPQPVGDLLAPPAEMSEAQKAEWSYALDNAPAGLLRRLDRNLFAQWVVASVDLVEAELALRTEGKIVKKGGDSRITINPDGSQVKTLRSASMVQNP